MKIFFVMDILNGICVLAERGERSNYLPVEKKSEVVKKSDPIEVFEEIRPKNLYIADLDRIMGKGDNFDKIRVLSKKAYTIADCGFRDANEIKNLPFKPVLGTETFDITKLEDKCYVSLDFKEKFLDASGKFKSWRDALIYLNSLELEGIIVLNLCKVGSLSPDFELLKSVLEISENPVLLGGGIGSLEHLQAVKDLGCDGVLMATAVHKKIVPISLIREGEF